MGCCRRRRCCLVLRGGHGSRQTPRFPSRISFNGVACTLRTHPSWIPRTWTPHIVRAKAAHMHMHRACLASAPSTAHYQLSFFPFANHTPGKKVSVFTPYKTHRSTLFSKHTSPHSSANTPVHTPSETHQSTQPRSNPLAPLPEQPTGPHSSSLPPISQGIRYQISSPTRPRQSQSPTRTNRHLHNQSYPIPS